MALIFFGGLGNVVNFMYQGKYKILLQAEGKSYIVTNITTIVNVLINVGKIILIIAGFQVLAVQVVFLHLMYCKWLCSKYIFIKIMAG